MAVLDHRIGRRHHLLGRLVADLHRYLVHGWERRRLVVRLQQFGALAQRVAVVRALANDVHRLPRVQADGVRDEPRVACVCGIDRPREAMRIAQAERPDFLARAARADERVVVRNPVASVVADRARRGLRGHVGNDSQDLADERVEALRVGSHREARLAGAAVAAADVKHAPVGIAWARRRIERQVPQRMDARVEGDAKQFARGAFERRVRAVRVGPFDQHALALGRPRRRDRRCRRVTVHAQAVHARVVWRVRAPERRIFDVDRVEAPVARVLGIELQADEAAGISGVERQLVEDPRVPLAAVEIEIHGELLGRLVEDVQRPVQIVDEEAAAAARFFAQRIDPREHPVGLALAVEDAGDRHRDEIGEPQRHARRVGRMQRRQTSKKKCDSRHDANDSRTSQIKNLEFGIWNLECVVTLSRRLVV